MGAEDVEVLVEEGVDADVDVGVGAALELELKMRDDVEVAVVARVVDPRVDERMDVVDVEPDEAE